MEDFYLILRLLFFAWILFVPQFLGVLVHYRMKRFPKFAYLIGFLLTTILSFYLMVAVFVPKVQPDERVCGLGSMAMITSVLFFTFLQIIGGLFAQLWMRARKILKQAGIN